MGKVSPGNRRSPGATYRVEENVDSDRLIRASRMVPESAESHAPPGLTGPDRIGHMCALTRKNVLLDP